MKLSAFLASPRPDGNSCTIAEEILRGAKTRGIDIKTFHLAEMKINDCLDCGHCKSESEVCCQKDDFVKCLLELLDSDILLFATPIYFGHISGRMKVFMDRWCVFFDSKFTVRNIADKRFITITTCASPTERFATVPEYLHYWFSYFFKLKPAGSIHAGDMVKKGDVYAHPDILQKAFELGQAL